MALSVEESDLMQRIIRFAIQKSKLSLGGLAEQQFPRNLAPVIEKWKNDNHEFRLDGVALLGFCVVNRRNVEVLLKEVKEASEKITLNLRLLFSLQELCTEIGELPKCDAPKIAKFTAEKDKITIADAHGDFWRLQELETDFDDLEPLDESLYQEMCDDEQVEPQYPELNIDTSYIEFNRELPVNNESHPISLPNSPPTLGLLQIDCQQSQEDVDTAPHTELTPGERDNEDLDCYQSSPSPIVSPPLLASQTISPERIGTPELHLEPITSSSFSPEAVHDSEDPIPSKKPRLQPENPYEIQLSQFNAFKLQHLLNRQTSELREALKTLRLEIQKTSKRPEASMQMTSPVRAYLDRLEPVGSEFRRRGGWEDVGEDSEDEPEDVEPLSRDSGIPEDVPSSNDVIDEDCHTETVIEDVREDFLDSEDFFLDSGCDFLNSNDYEAQFNAPNAPKSSKSPEEHIDKSPDAIKTELKKAVEGADGKPISLLSTINPLASRKTAVRTFFAVLEMAKTRELAPPTQNEPFGDIFLSKNEKNC